jgi:hypothetical protein
MSIAACLAQPLLVADRASAASYFCTPVPIKIGSYRPEDADDELDIRVHLPIGSFWFDDQTGDYQADGGGHLEPGKLTVPLPATPIADSLSVMVRGTFDAGQCVASGMGVHPTRTNEATESRPK